MLLWSRPSRAFFQRILGVLAGELPKGQDEGFVMRLTQKVIQQLLDQNNGFRTTTHYSGKNFTESRVYQILDGVLHIHSKGKTSWADSRFDNTSVADLEQTRRFLRSVLASLNRDGLE